MQPRATITRGELVIRNYYKGVGLGHGAQVFCEVDIRGVRYRPFHEEFHGCSLGPAADPLAATLVIEGGPDRGLYLLRLVDGRTALEKLSADATFNGSWTSDGSTYIHMGRAFDVRSGRAHDLPKFPGEFLCFSPDGKVLVSYEFSTASAPVQEITIHQTHTSTGRVDSATVSRATYGFLLDSTHLVPGTLESAHIWKAAQLTWEKGPGGEDRLKL